MGTANFAKVRIVRDTSCVYGVEPNQKRVEFTWRDTAKGQDQLLYVRGDQAEEELVWVSPMWITYR